MESLIYPRMDKFILFFFRKHDSKLNLVCFSYSLLSDFIVLFVLGYRPVRQSSSVVTYVTLMLINVLIRPKWFQV